MKTTIRITLLAAVLLGTLPAMGSAATSISAGIHIGSSGRARVDVGFFYDDLASYGHWIQRPRYGWVWTPRVVARSWRPYEYGHWVWTDLGWTWVSDEPFGWATYHYGRWYDDPDYGWEWVPGDRWAPAWVDWHANNDYVGWAPLPPDVGYSPGVTLNVDLAPEDFVFVPENRFLDTRVYDYAAPSWQCDQIYRSTRSWTRYQSYNDQVFNAGFPVDSVQQWTGRPVQRYQVADMGWNDRHQGARFAQDRVAMFRPQVDKVRVDPPSARPIASRAVLAGVAAAQWQQQQKIHQQGRWQQQQDRAQRQALVGQQQQQGRQQQRIQNQQNWAQQQGGQRLDKVQRQAQWQQQQQTRQQQRLQNQQNNRAQQQGGQRLDKVQRQAQWQQQQQTRQQQRLQNQQNRAQQQGGQRLDKVQRQAQWQQQQQSRQQQRWQRQQDQSQQQARGQQQQARAQRQAQWQQQQQARQQQRWQRQQDQAQQQARGQQQQDRAQRQAEWQQQQQARQQQRWQRQQDQAQQQQARGQQQQARAERQAQWQQQQQARQQARGQRQQQQQGNPGQGQGNHHRQRPPQ
ncbi:MAG TPA: DUF6600 domain-containing protein [Thermoanaerobaculia bacterium]|jgi:hypothetical protein|nr:DUF6600 domain-containing protein [Thermoanaerobaculia bacterium]